MNFAEMLNASVNAASFSKERKRRQPSGGPAAMRRKADERYKAAMTGQQLTTGEVANKIGYSHASILHCLYKLRDRGMVKVVGVRERPVGMPPGRGTLIWEWVSQ